LRARDSLPLPILANVKFASWNKTLTLCVKCLGVGHIAVAEAKRNVLVAGELAAANGDPCACVCAKNPCPCGDPSKNVIFSGAADVLVGHDMAPAAGILDITFHNTGSHRAPNSLLLFGHPFVWLGGGTVVGNVALMNRLCVAARDARRAAKQGKPGQKYQNCGLECVRQVVNAARHPAAPLSEDDVMNQAIRDGNCSITMTEAEFARVCPADAALSKREWLEAENKMKASSTDDEFTAADAQLQQAKANMRDRMERCVQEVASNQSRAAEYARLKNAAKNDPRAKDKSGGTLPHQQAAVADGYGVPVDQKYPIQSSEVPGWIQEGKGVIVNLDATKAGIAGPNEAANEAHAVVLTGVQYDDDGNLVGYRYNDPATDECCQFMPRDKFNEGIQGGTAIVTQQPIGA
jgi:hypothetical protein